MIIIEIIFAKINNPQQNSKHFAKKISTNQCKLYSCVLSLVEKQHGVSRREKRPLAGRETAFLS